MWSQVVEFAFRALEHAWVCVYLHNVAKTFLVCVSQMAGVLYLTKSCRFEMWGIVIFRWRPVWKGIPPSLRELVSQLNSTLKVRNLVLDLQIGGVSGQISI